MNFNITTMNYLAKNNEFIFEFSSTNIDNAVNKIQELWKIEKDTRIELYQYFALNCYKHVHDITRDKDGRIIKLYKSKI